MKAVKNRARLDPMLEALGGIAVAGVIALAYWRIASGISTVGDFMGFITALLMAAQPIRALGSLSARIQEGLAAAESFYGLIDEKPTIVDQPGAQPLAIADAADPLRGRRLRLRPQRRARRSSNFSLEVPGGAHRGARRPLGRRQVDGAQSRAAPVRRRSRAASPSTARTSATSRSPRCAAPSPSSART